MRHDDDLDVGVGVLGEEGLPELVEVLVEGLVVCFEVGVRGPAWFERSLAVFLDEILDAAAETDDHKIIPEFVNASVDISVWV